MMYQNEYQSNILYCEGLNDISAHVFIFFFLFSLGDNRDLMYHARILISLSDNIPGITGIREKNVIYLKIALLIYRFW